jgi:formylglycine-generating enzyme required for sulfatase activity
MKKITAFLLMLFICSMSEPLSAIAQIEMVLIGNPGQGGVDYSFKVGCYEITVQQYVDFLNSVATDDPNGLYNPDMAGTYGGIIRNGSPGSYSYQPKIGWANKPVTFVPWLNAARFTNWLHNGQPTGPQSTSTTESGAYNLLITDPIVNASRSTSALWFIPSSQEWIKAGYFDPTKGGVIGGGFWNWPTRSDSAPTGELPPGGNNSTNYDWAVGSSTDVGSYPNSISYYGTFDQVGNVWEFVEDTIGDGERGRRGDSFTGWYGSGSIGHYVGTGGGTFTGDSDTGFRVASISNQAPISIDIIPKNCPNECPIKGGGFVEVAIHSNADFDVTDIDIASVRLEGVAPVRSSFKDKSSQVVSPSGVCDCTAEGRDGFIDLCLKFEKKAIFDALGGVNIGNSFLLTLTGELNDGTPIEGQDCIDIVKKGKKENED